VYNLNEDMQINVQKVILSIGLVCCTSVAAIDYDPLNTKIDPGSVKTLDTSFTYGKQEREIPVLVYLPSSAMKAPVVIFSHGLGGLEKGPPFLGSTGRHAVTWRSLFSIPGVTNRSWRDCLR